MLDDNEIKDLKEAPAGSPLGLIILFVIAITLAFGFVFISDIISTYEENKAIKNGNYVEESFIIDKINFEKNESLRITANIETENDFIVLFIDGDKREINFERSQEKYNKVEVSKYEYKGKLGRKSTLYTSIMI